MSEAAISFLGVSKRFGETEVFRDLSFGAASGEILVLLGPSGCGKTTLLRMVNRLAVPDAGQVFVGGREVGSHDPVALRRRIGYVIQGVGLLPHFSVLENAALVPRLLGWPAGHRRKRAADMLRLVGLDPETHGRRRPAELSGGQQQRVGVARALAADPDLLLMDEPFGAVDPIARRRLVREFGALVRRLGKTVLFVTHDVGEAFRLADRIAVLGEGRLRQLGTPGELARAPADELVRELIAGWPGAAPTEAGPRAAGGTP